MTADEFRELALTLEGATEVGHFDRKAFKVRRIFASLSPDGLSANICLTPEEQEHFAGLWPDVFAPVPNKWGARGWTRLHLAAADADTIRPALQSAWKEAGERKRRSKL